MIKATKDGGVAFLSASSKMPRELKFTIVTGSMFDDELGRNVTAAIAEWDKRAAAIVAHDAEYAGYVPYTEVYYIGAPVALVSEGASSGTRKWAQALELHLHFRRRIRATKRRTALPNEHNEPEGPAS